MSAMLKVMRPRQIKMTLSAEGARINSLAAKRKRQSP